MNRTGLIIIDDIEDDVDPRERNAIILEAVVDHALISAFSTPENMPYPAKIPRIKI